MEKQIKVYWLVIIVIVLLSVFVFIQTSNSNNDLVQYFSFAGSITSLVLGLIAIFYSIISNQQSSENFGKLNEAVTKVEEGADVIRKVSDSINSRLDRISDDIVKFGYKGNENQTTKISELISEEVPLPDQTGDLPNEEDRPDEGDLPNEEDRPDEGDLPNEEDPKIDNQ